jgi:hypothetical protein
MDLNLPIFDHVADCENLLIAGMGGGFDVFCGLPIYLELQKRGQTVHLASYSFTDLEMFGAGVRLTETLVGVTADYDGLALYFPELYLTRWFRERRGEAVTLWSFHKTGTRPLLENYRVLVDHLEIDGILLIDGGVDSLVRGDESGRGTMIEDAISLYAVNELQDVPTRIMGCTAFGAELGITYAHIFENIATLTEAGGFLGACSLTPQMAAYQAYEDAVLYVQGRRYQDPSVINSSIVSAVQGHYGNYHLTEKTRGSRLWISPLMPLYWFFDLPTVADYNYYLSQLAYTETFMDAFRSYSMAAKVINKRPTARIPLK